MDVNATETPGGPDDRLLPWSQVKIIAGLSRTTIWRLQKSGDFPAAVQVSPHRVGWWQSELLAWKRARTPRRLPQPRVPAPVIHPSPAASPSARGVAPSSLETARSEGGAATVFPRRRRSPSVSPDQGAFDF